MPKINKPKELDWEKEFEKRFILGDGCIDLDGMGKETVDSLKEFIKLQIQESYWLGIKVMEEENEIQDTRLNNLKNEITEAIKDWSSLSETRRIYKTKVLGILTQILEDLKQI